MPTRNCLVCHTPNSVLEQVTSNGRIKDAIWVDCPQCGRFEITGPAVATLRSFSERVGSAKAMVATELLSRWIAERMPRNPTVTVMVAEEVLEEALSSGMSRETVYYDLFHSPDKRLRVLVDGLDGEVTVTASYGSRIRTHGKTKEEAINAMADLLEQEFGAEQFKKAFSHVPRGQVTKREVTDRSGTRRMCHVGCVTSGQVGEPMGRDFWVIFVPMDELSASAPNLGEAIAGLHDLVSKARVDDVFLLAFLEGMFDLKARLKAGEVL